MVKNMATCSRSSSPKELILIMVRVPTCLVAPHADATLPALTLPARVRTQEIDHGVAAGVAHGFDANAIRVELEGSVSVDRRDGIWWCIAGGALGLAGGILTLRWAKSAEPA